MKILYKVQNIKQINFLCGTYYKGKSDDRRKILVNSLNECFKDKENRPLFIIVDEILNPNVDSFLIEDNTRIKILEEIVSLIVSHTYIFIDSISSAYEYGLFNNSYSKNDLKLFVDNDRKGHITIPDVGEYVKGTIPCGSLVEYPAVYKYNDATGKDYIYFINNELPESIKNIIINDYNLLNNNEIIFGFDNNKTISEPGVFNYVLDKKSKKLKIFLGLHTLFHLTCYARIETTPKYKFNLGNSNLIKHKIEGEIIKILFRDCEEISNDLDILLGNYDISFNTLMTDNKKFSFEFLVKCMIYLIVKFSFNNHLGSLPYLRENSYIVEYADISYDFFNFLNINSLNKKIIKSYLTKSSNFINKHTLLLKNKIRNIDTYLNNSNGNKLRKLHDDIVSGLSILYKFNDSSFAYQHGKNCINCVKEHIKSRFFIKLDIHNFFNSIRRTRLIYFILKDLQKMINSFFHEYGIYETSSPQIYNLDILIKCCFKKYKLPIGFTSSPILSNIYLNKFDDDIKKKFPNLIYTRYADDILISSKYKIENTSEIVDFIRSKLYELKLYLNLDKTKKISIQNKNNGVKFLGLVLVNRGNLLNEIKISRKYFNMVLYGLIKSYKNEEPLTFERNLEKLRYIKNVDTKSFNKVVNILNPIFSKIELSEIRKEELRLFKNTYNP